MIDCGLCLAHWYRMIYRGGKVRLPFRIQKSRFPKLPDLQKFHFRIQKSRDAIIPSTISICSTSDSGSSGIREFRIPFRTQLFTGGQDRVPLPFRIPPGLSRKCNVSSNRLLQKSSVAKKTFHGLWRRERKVPDP